MVLSLFTREIFNILKLKCIKLTMGCLYLISAIYLSTKIVILTICNTILSFPDLLLKTVFHGTESISYLGPAYGIYFLLLKNNYAV